MEKWTKQYKLGRNKQVEISKKKQKTIIDGTDKVESLLNTDNMSSNMFPFFKKESHSL